MVQELHRMMELPFVSMVATIIEIVDDREVHMVPRWERFSPRERAEPGICIRFGCRDN